MSTLTTLCLGFSFLATSALADEMAASPTYLGDRSINPEQETYAIRVDSAIFARAMAFIGPVRSVGPATGDPEKDTFAYTPLIVDPEAVQAFLDNND